MQIICSKCGLVIKSLIIDKDKAIQEISDELTKHIVKSHKQEHEILAKNVMTIFQGLTWYLIMYFYATIDVATDQGKYLDAKVAEYQVKLVEMLGLTVTEDKIEEGVEEIESKEEIEITGEPV